MLTRLPRYESTGIQVSSEKDNSVELTKYISSNYANEIKAELEVAMDAARTIAQIFESYESLTKE